MIRFRPLAAVAFFALASLASGFAQSTVGVFTSRYNVARTGLNSNETILNHKNVNSSTFGKIFSYAVDGQVYAQPLYVQGLSIPGQGTHNVLFVETQMDSVYAFDADGTTGIPLWQDSFIDLAQGIEPVPCGTDGDSDISCGVFPYYGITGTPVIDPTTNTMYLVARTYNTNTLTGAQMLHALDITTGAEKFGGPVLIQGSVPGTGTGSSKGIVPFNELADIQRAGLLLLNGTVYIAWAGAEHGWIMAYDATTLAQNAIFATTPNAHIGGVWQTGNGLAADHAGYIYASVGDAMFDADSGGTDYGDTLMKMNSSLQVVDYFTPMDQDCRKLNDFDLASSGPMILPVQSSTYPDEVLASGKGGDPCDATGAAPIYLVNRDNMGKFSSTQDNIIQEIEGSQSGYWSNPAFWGGSTQGYIYYAGTTDEGHAGDTMKMYSLTNGMLSTTPVAVAPDVFPVGATPTVSSDNGENPIVWVVARQDLLGVSPGQTPAIFYAYNGNNIATQLYNNTQNAERDQVSCGNKFQVPTVFNGNVYVATQNEVEIFGLIGTPAAAPWVSLSQRCHTFDKEVVGTMNGGISHVKVTNSGTTSLTISSITITGLNAGDFAQTNNCTEALAPGAPCNISITFSPSATGPRVGQLIINDNAIDSPQNTFLEGVGEASSD